MKGAKDEKLFTPSILDTFQDFLIAEHMKPFMHLLKISISSLNHVNVRATKTPKLADKTMCSILPLTTNAPLNWYSLMKKKIRKVRIIFDIENSL